MISISELRNQLEEQQIEIERLRDSHEIAAWALADRQKELDRLRELLLGSYRFIPRHEGMEQCDCIVCQLRNRVREALGENHD